MKQHLMIIASVGAVMALGGVVTGDAHVHAQQPTPVSATAKVSVRVVYDINNDGAPDADDPPLTDRDATLAASAESAPIVAKSGIAVDVPAGSYTVFAIGPKYVPGEEGKSGALCRGWRTSYILGAPLTANREQPPPGLGFVIDLAATDPATPATEIVLGLSDKGAKGTEQEGVQIVCPLPGEPAGLPTTGGGGAVNASAWRMPLLVVAVAAALTALGATRMMRPGRRGGER